MRRLLCLVTGCASLTLSWLLLIEATVPLRQTLARVLRLTPDGRPVHVHTVQQLGAVLALLQARGAHAAQVALHAPVWHQPAGGGGLLLAACGLVLVLSAFYPGGRQARERREREVREKEKQEQKAEANKPVVAPTDDLRRDGWLSSGDGGWPLGTDTTSGRAIALPRARQAEHVLVIGGTGSGKSSRFLLPWIMAEADLPPEVRASLLIMDPKAGGELTDTTIGYLAERGYRVLVYDPTSAGTVRCNVLAAATTAAGVKAVVTQWVECLSGSESSYWRQVTVALIAGAALYLRAQAGPDWRRVSMADVATFYRDHTIEQATELVVAAAATQDGADAVVRDLAGQLTSLAATPATRGGAMSGVRLRLECLTDARVAASMRGHDLDAAFWGEFIATPTALYVPLAMEDAAAIRPVVVTFLTAAIVALDRQAGTGNRPLSRPVRVIVDEFANLGRIAGIARIVSTARFRNIGLALATQSPTDIRRVYGRDADAIMDNLLTHIVLSKSRADALKRYAIAALHVDLPLLMERDTALVQRAGDLPIRVTTRGWFRSRSLRRGVARARAGLDKAGALAHQARVLGGTVETPGEPDGRGEERETAWLGGDAAPAPREEEGRDLGAEDDNDGEDAAGALLAAWDA